MDFGADPLGRCTAYKTERPSVGETGWGSTTDWPFRLKVENGGPHLSRAVEWTCGRDYILRGSMATVGSKGRRSFNPEVGP